MKKSAERKKHSLKHFFSVAKLNSDEFGAIVCPAAKQRSVLRKIGSFALRFCSFALIGVLFFILIQIEFPDKVEASEQGGINAEALIRGADGDASICIVYSEMDDWSESESMRLAELIDTAYDIKVDIAKDTADAKALEKYTLYITLGHTELSTEDYLTGLLRLGYNGYEITHKDDSDGKTVCININAFNADAARQAIDRFAEHFLSSTQTLSTLSSLYVTVYDSENTELPVVIKADPAGDICILTVSKPGADSYSLKALASMIDKYKPSLVVFDGGLDCDCTDRASLSEAWDDISTTLGYYDIKFTCLFSYDDTGASVPNDLVYEVISACKGYIDSVTEYVTYGSRTRASRTCFLFTDENGTPLMSLFGNDFSAVSTAEEISATVAWIDSLNTAFTRVGAGNCISEYICPGIAKSAAAFLKSYVRGSDSKAVIYSVEESSVFDDSSLPIGALIKSGMDYFNFSFGNINVGTISVPKSLIQIDASGEKNHLDGNINVAFTGSLSFSSFGLGGSFDINNSLRGGTVLTVHADGNTTFEYVYAKDLGAVAK